MTTARRRYYMYPQKTYAGHAETEILSDGRIKYYLHMMGMDEPNELVVDPCNENDMRGVRQLHLIMSDTKDDTAATDYVIDGDDLDGVIGTIRQMFRPIGTAAHV